MTAKNSWLNWLTLALCSSALPACGAEIDGESLGETNASLTATSTTDRAALALRYAPVHYQDVDQTGSHALGGRADYIARYDFDGDLNGRNNWDNAGNAAFPLSAHGYYSVVETSTHWFIVYMFFHPRDWSDSFFDTEHENDTEGLLVSVQRDGSKYGSLKSVVTVAHTDFFSYLPGGGSWQGGAESVDGTLQMANFGGALHPVTAQEAKGHGLKARPGYDIVGDGVVYYPTLDTAEVPSGPDDRDVRYKLVDIFEPGGLWAQSSNPSLFGGYGAFAGDKSGGCGSGTIGCGENSANTPWSWDDGNDGPSRGALGLDPAGLTSNYFRVPEPSSNVYTFNPYLQVQDNALYDLRPSHAGGKCADVAGGSGADGAEVVLWDCHGKGNQLFWAFAQADGYFVFVNAQSGKCLDQVPGSSDGLDVIQHGCHFGSNQLWRPESAGGSYVKLVNKQSGRVLEVSGNQSTSNGANVQTWTYDGSGDMRWQLVRH
jgi:hypothetical protein